jgi:hypothetical protein
VTVPVTLTTALLLAALTEVWVRASWDEQRGTPGLFLSHPTRGQQLAPGYAGWFAGVPIRINNLGFRDEHDAVLEKGPRTFRILVLGDSVTFGHGSVHTYPALLENLLRGWRADIDWQVWNAGVPGYNTSQELTHLLEIGPAAQPDLVVVGFFENDLIDNREPTTASMGARVRSEALAFVQRHVYSFELYKRLFLSAAWWLSDATTLRRRLEHLDTESALLASDAPMHERPEQQLTPYERLAVPPEDTELCFGRERLEPGFLAELTSSQDWNRWLAAVHRFHALNESRQYRIVFFLNVVPPPCPNGDFFYGKDVRPLHDLYMQVLSSSLPAATAFDTFLRRRPSQMPAARAHAIGNSNLTKAEALFEYLTREWFRSVPLDEYLDARATNGPSTRALQRSR